MEIHISPVRIRSGLGFLGVHNYVHKYMYILPLSNSVSDVEYIYIYNYLKQMLVTHEVHAHLNGDVAIPHSTVGSSFMNSAWWLSLA